MLLFLNSVVAENWALLTLTPSQTRTISDPMQQSVNNMGLRRYPVRTHAEDIKIQKMKVASFDFRKSVISTDQCLTRNICTKNRNAPNDIILVHILFVYRKLYKLRKKNTMEIVY